MMLSLSALRQTSPLVPITKSIAGFYGRKCISRQYDSNLDQYLRIPVLFGATTRVFQDAGEVPANRK